MSSVDLETPMADTVNGLRQYFDGGASRSLNWRRQQLASLKQMLIQEENRLLEALRQDLGKHPQEGWTAEISSVAAEIDHTLKHLKKWSKPRKVRTPLVVQPGSSSIQPEPLGVVLIMGAWNYPLQLVLSPLIPAIAAGNCVVIKPSELAANTSALLAELLPRYLDEQAFRVVEGAVEETTALLEQRFDHIFYTGGPNVGRIVMTAAARHLTPVTLELGGKSPCIVDEGVDLDLVARRIAWGKWMNAGQTCIAPDYLLCTEAMAQPLAEALYSAVVEMYGDDPSQSDDYGRLINFRHQQRVAAYLQQGEIVFGGRENADDCYIAPTLLRNVPDDAPVLQEEIFGPVLPLVVVEDMAAAQDYINQREKPLALYLFSNNRLLQRQVQEGCPAGNMCINDTMMFMAVPDLPFGGVGNSGMGAYHGEHGFKTFSHYKSVLKRANILDLNVRYAPFSDKKFAMLRKLR